MVIQKMVLERLKLDRMMVITKYGPAIYTNELNNAHSGQLVL